MGPQGFLINNMKTIYAALNKKLSGLERVLVLLMLAFACAFAYKSYTTAETSASYERALKYIAESDDRFAHCESVVAQCCQ